MESLPERVEQRLSIYDVINNNPNMPIETLERLMTLQERFEANERMKRLEEAEQAFYEALREFQYRIPQLKKTKQAKSDDGKLYAYCPLDEMERTCRPLLYELGFSYTFDTEPNEERYTAIFELHHKQGFSRTTRFSPRLVKQTKAMNSAQQDAGTVTFAKRYAMANGLGLTNIDEDTDAQRTVTVQPEELSSLVELLEALNIPQGEICTQFKVEQLQQLPHRTALNVIRKLTQLKEERAHNE